MAVVNTEPITNNEVRARMARFERQLTQQGQPIPPRQEFARQVLERLISEKAQLQLARESGVKIDEALVDQAEQNVARQNQIDVPELRRRLDSDGMSLAQFREELRNQLLLTRLRERELEARGRVTDLDLDQYLREQRENAQTAAPEINLAHILISAPENATQAQLANLQGRAQRVQQRALAGEDFARLTAEFSDVQGAAANGGEVGLRAADRYPPLFAQAVQDLPVGGVSEVLRSGAGFHVVKLVERRQAVAPGTEVQQSHARHILLRTNARQSEAQAVQRLAEYKRRVESGQTDFAQLAREFSEDASAKSGGDLGWTNPGVFVPEFEDAMNGLSPGQIADPLISRFGVHLIQLLERRQAALGEREQREMARNQVREKKLDDAYLQWAQEVRGRAYVEMREPPQ